MRAGSLPSTDAHAAPVPCRPAADELFRLHEELRFSRAPLFDVSTALHISQTGGRPSGGQAAWQMPCCLSAAEPLPALCSLSHCSLWSSRCTRCRPRAFRWRLVHQGRGVVLVAGFARKPHTGFCDNACQPPARAGSYRLLPRVIEDELQQPGQRLERPGELEEAARAAQRRDALRRLDFLLRSKLLAVRRAGRAGCWGHAECRFSSEGMLGCRCDAFPSRKAAAAKGGAGPGGPSLPEARRASWLPAGGAAGGHAGAARARRPGHGGCGGRAVHGPPHAGACPAGRRHAGKVPPAGGTRGDGSRWEPPRAGGCLGMRISRGWCALHSAGALAGLSRPCQPWQRAIRWCMPAPMQTCVSLPTHSPLLLQPRRSQRSRSQLPTPAHPPAQQQQGSRPMQAHQQRQRQGLQTSCGRALTAGAGSCCRLSCCRQPRGMTPRRCCLRSAPGCSSTSSSACGWQQTWSSWCGWESSRG